MSQRRPPELPQTAWEQHLLTRLEHLTSTIRKLRRDVHYQRRRADLWKHRALTKKNR